MVIVQLNEHRASGIVADKCIAHPGRKEENVLAGIAIVSGGVNAEATEWGMKLTDARTRRFLEMAGRFIVNIAKVENTTTFRRVDYREIISVIIFAFEVIGREGNRRLHIVPTYCVAREQATRRTPSQLGPWWKLAQLKDESLALRISKGKGIESHIRGNWRKWQTKSSGFRWLLMSLETLLILPNLSNCLVFIRGDNTECVITE